MIVGTAESRASRSQPARRSLGATLGAAVAYAVAVAYLAWPLVLTPGSALIDPVAIGGPGSVWAKADLDLLIWILSWTSHALRAQPGALFQANIFHPAPDALASSEHLIGLAPLAAPLYWLSGNPILTYNLTVMVVVWAVATCTFVLVRAWTGSSAAAFLAGAAFGLGPQLVASFIRLHSSAVYFFPLILLLSARAAREPRPRTIFALALVTALQALAGVYVAFELIVLIAAFVPALWLEARRHRKSVWPAVIAMAAGGAALLPTALPYLRIREAGLLPPLEHAKELVELTSASLPMLAALIGSHARWPLLALAALGLVWSSRVAWNLRLGVLLVGVAGAVFTAGTGLPLVPGTSLPSAYEVAMRFVPGFAGMRSPTRFAVLVLLALSVLAGIGAAQLLELARTRRAARVANLLVVLATCALVVARAPRPSLPVAAASLDGPLGAVHRWLRDRGEPGPVLELPAMVTPMDGRAVLATGRAMVGSTVHWMPLVNGYSGHPPASDRLLMTLAQRLPDPTALETLRELAGPRWLVVHLGLMSPREEERWTSAPAPGLEEVGRFGKTVVYRVPPAVSSRSAALLRQLAGADNDRTLDGASLAALGATAAHGTIRGSLPAAMVAGGGELLWLDVRNDGDATWPGLAVAPRGGVELRARWRDARGVVVAEDDPLPLARDLAPGGTVRAQLEVFAPAMPGTYTLEIALEQSGFGALDDVSGAAPPLRGEVSVTAIAAAASTTGGR